MIYAAYKGEEIVAMGTLKEVAQVIQSFISWALEQEEE